MLADENDLEDWPFRLPITAITHSHKSAAKSKGKNLHFLSHSGQPAKKCWGPKDGRSEELARHAKLSFTGVAIPRAAARQHHLSR